MCYLFIESTFVVSFRFSSHKAKFYLLWLSGEGVGRSLNLRRFHFDQHLIVTGGMMASESQPVIIAAGTKGQRAMHPEFWLSTWLFIW